MEHRSWVIKLVICLLGLANPNPAIADESLADTAVEQVHAETLIAEYFPDNYRIMKAIAICESGLIHRQPDGNLKQNDSGTSAEGMFQVLMSAHKKEMLRLGLDSNNDDDYMTYVKIMYNAQGLAPWADSKKCWKRKVKT